MRSAALQPLGGWRNEPCRIPFTIPGVDLTGTPVRAQVRVTADNPIVLLDLPPVTDPNATGIRIVSVTRDANGLPATNFMWQVATADMQKMPYAGEVGDAFVGQYALQVGGITRVFGPFAVLASPIDSNSAPLNRPYTPGTTGWGSPIGGFVLNLDGGVSISLLGIDLLAPLVGAATASAAAAALSKVQADASAALAGLKAVAAAGSAADAGGALAAVRQVVGNLPAGAQQPYQATTRAALALFTLQTNGQQAYLGEPGREGTFKWQPGDQSAKVAIDPAQGVYVAPASDATGKSGAWARVGMSPVRDAWFGAVYDGVTDIAPAWSQMFTLLGGLAVNAGGGLRGGFRIRLGSGRARLASVVRAKGFSAIWEGDSTSTGSGAGSATVIACDAGAGLVLDRGNTPDATVPFGADGTCLGNITFVGNGQGAQPLLTLHCRFHLHMVNCVGGGSDGLAIIASSGVGGAQEGEASCSSIYGGAFTGNAGSGISAVGSDPNAINAYAYDASGNGRYGVDDGSFLGNNWNGHHASNTLGPIRVTNPNARSVLYGAYTESNQSPTSVSQHSLIVGGTHGAGTTYNSPFVSGYFGNVSVNGLFSSRGAADGSGSLQVAIGASYEGGAILSAAITGTLANPSNPTLRYRGQDMAWGLGYGDTTIAVLWSGSNTTQTFGRSNPTPNVYAIPRFSLGSRIMQESQGLPVNGTVVASGDRFWNIYAAPGGPAEYYVTTGGIVGSTAVLKTCNIIGS